MRGLWNKLKNIFYRNDWIKIAIEELENQLLQERVNDVVNKTKQKMTS